jgi:hypothetical protein
MADDEVTIDWGAASVDGRRLTVPYAGKPPNAFKPAVAHVIERLDRGGSGWGAIKVGRPGCASTTSPPAPRTTCGTCSRRPSSRRTPTSAMTPRTTMTPASPVSAVRPTRR